MMHSCCTSNTPLKHAHWRQFVDLHLTIWRAACRRQPWIRPTYLYFDLNGGPGVYYPSDGVGVSGPEPCSGIDFLRMAHGKHVAAKAMIMEQDEDMYERCRSEVASEPGTVYTSVHHGDCLECVQQLPACEGAYIGLAYADPAGAGKQEWLALQELARKYKYVDILIHLQAASMKRCNRAPQLGSTAGYLTLRENIAALRRCGKRCFLVRKPYGKHQHSFLFASRWTKYPPFESIEFHGIDDLFGQCVLNQMDKTKKELA